MVLYDLSSPPLAHFSRPEESAEYGRIVNDLISMPA